MKMLLKKIKKMAFVAMASLAVLPAAGQDLLANQAPIDRKMKAIDSIALHRLLEDEIYESSATQLYTDWNNQFTALSTALPDSFLINLRDFCMPTPSRVVTSNFGSRWGRQHKGLDIKVYIGDTIRAAFDGRVRVVRYEGRGYGKYVVIRHDNGLETYYAHLSKQLVSEDQDVRAGDPIGLGGNTGRSTGSHLHFETRLCGMALNPALMFDFRNQDVVDDYFTFHKSSYQRESQIATRLRGANVGSGEDVELATAAPAASYAQESRFHKVKKGETLFSIAKKRGTTVDTIMKLNHLKKNAKLKAGQILKFN
jgi:murein DD-endopeptidase MepM/ murein hydrolase activator NlpD